MVRVGDVDTLDRWWKVPDSCLGGVGGPNASIVAVLDGRGHMILVEASSRVGNDAGHGCLRPDLTHADAEGAAEDSERRTSLVQVDREVRVTLA